MTHPPRNATMTKRDRQAELDQMISAAAQQPGVLDVLTTYGDRAQVLEQMSAYLQQKTGTPSFGATTATS